MYLQQTIGSMLQGVSQQPARIRLPGQVTEQVNFDSNVAQGLTTRPPTRHVRELAGAVDGLKYHAIQYLGKQYIIGYDVDTLRIWDTNGAQYPVKYQDWDAQDYVGGDMRFVAYDNDIFAVNRNVTVLTDADIDGYPFHATIVTCLGGAYLQTYKIGVTFSNGAVITVEYTTTEGSELEEAEGIRPEFIMAKLYDEFVAASLPAGATVYRVSDTILIKHPDTMRVTVQDGEGGKLMRAISDDADSRDDLPRFAPEGTVVKVVGDGSAEDDYYLRFNVKVPGVNVGNGFGRQGVWEEHFNVSQRNKLLARTMPHALTLRNGEFVFERVGWSPRRVGDEDSNPFPSFVGNRIRDISGFESRLVFVAGAACIMSRTNYPKDFFRKSALTQIDSDPIDMKSSRDGTLNLDWIVPFEKSLLLLSDPGNSQFIIDAGGITPKNSSMVLSTSYELFGLARPVSTGRTMIFPFSSGDYSGMKEFFTRDQVSANAADTITQVQDRYIAGVVDYMQTSTNYNMLTLQTNHTGRSLRSTLWVYKWLWDGDNKLQSAWCKWRFDHWLIYHFFENSRLYLITRLDANLFNLEVLDLNNGVDYGPGYSVTLDGKRWLIPSETSTIVLPYSDAAFVFDRGGRAGQEVNPVSVVQTGATEYTYTFDPLEVITGTTLICGRRMLRQLMPTMPMIKDRNNTTISSAKVVLNKFIVHLEDTGAVDFIRRCPHREDLTQTIWAIPIGDDSITTFKDFLRSDAIEVPWGERADLSEFEIRSRDIRPTTILEIEWEGQVTGAKRRG